ncbi:hypothetical protein Tco_1095066, partial [Tanacetum coccineum]
MRREEEEETWVLKMERRTEEEEDNCSATLDLHLKFLDNFINLFRTLTHHNYINVNEGFSSHETSRQIPIHPYTKAEEKIASSMPISKKKIGLGVTRCSGGSWNSCNGVYTNAYIGDHCASDQNR